jgi:uncharacterized protein
MRHVIESLKGENLIPIIRARLSLKLQREGLRVGEIASALGITPAAVVQYLHGKRGRANIKAAQVDRIIDALADKVLKRVSVGGAEGLRVAELIEAAEQLTIAVRGSKVLEVVSTTKGRDVELLKQRLQLELRASERCLESAVKFDDEYSKLLLRMIAADSIRHADVVSQIISWIELSHEPTLNLPKRELLDTILQVEDKAAEVSLTHAVKISHPIANLLLEWIDSDEKKHEKIIGKMVKALQ